MGERLNWPARRVIEDVLAGSVEANKPICLDSSALIAYLASEHPISDLVDLILTHAGAPVVISAVSLTEALVRPARAGDRFILEQTRDALVALPRFAIVAFDERHAMETAVVRAHIALKLPDAAIVATARLADVYALIGNDRQCFNKLLGVTFLCMDGHPVASMTDDCRGQSGL